MVSEKKSTEKLRSPKWTREETILALNLYYNIRYEKLSSDHPEIQSMSKILNLLHKKTLTGAARNPTAVYFKLLNLADYDPEYEGKTFPHGSKTDEMVWNEFVGDIERLRGFAQTLHGHIESDMELVNEHDEENFSVGEGKIFFRIHRLRERNPALINRVKDKARRNGKLRCEVCNFDFFATYGFLGEGYIECHHTVPLSTYCEKSTTNIKDLALVCSNCHRMLHKSELLSIEELREIISKNKKGS